MTKKAILARLEKEISETHGVAATVKDPRPLDGVVHGYLILNLYVCIYVLYTGFHGRSPKPILYIPIVFLAIGWAPSIHTVTAFLFQGLGGRPFWNTGLIAPRFLASAWAAAPSAPCSTRTSSKI